MAPAEGRVDGWVRWSKPAQLFLPAVQIDKIDSSKYRDPEGS